MTRLVLHAGVEFTDGGAVQRDLAAWREPLRAAGVLTPTDGDASGWRETAQGLLRQPVSTPAADLLAEAAQQAAEVVLVSSDALSDALTSPDEVASLVQTAESHGLEVRVVVVVREQIGYINSLYCHRVLGLETARSFAEFASTSVPAHRFDYVASFGALADADGVHLVAVPYPVLLAKGAGRAVLEAAGVQDEVLDRLPGGDNVPPPVPGPTLVSATRLLHKRLRRLAMFNEHGKPRLRQLVDGLVARASAGDWDSASFWGWDPTSRRRAEAEHGPTNQLFAEFVWGGPWPEPWSVGKAHHPDLADVEPAVLHDVFDAVQGLLDQVVKGPSDVPPRLEDVETGLDDDS